MLKKSEPQDFDKIYAIMEEAFPRDERRPYSEQKELLSKPEYSIYVQSDNGEVKAFITVYRFDGFAFIEHFAVNAKYRNMGLGASVLGELFGILRCRLCLEAELPETEMAKRRIEFYRRNGFYINNYDYVQPPISKGRKPVPLTLMTSGGTVSEEQFNNIKCVLYKNVYGIN